MKTNTIITNVRRLPNTTNGNPVWEFTLETGGTVRTRPDATVGHKVTPWGIVGIPVELTMENGEVIDFKLDH